MSAASRNDAQQRADHIRIFEQEMERLLHDGVLTLSDEQRSAVATHHQRLLSQYANDFDIDRDAHAKQLSLGMRIASFLGALALAASVFFLFRQFWGLFSTGAQVTILIGAALGSFAATMWLQGRDDSGYFTKLAALVAFACFAINIALLGQIFNITPSDKALLPWAVFALLLAYSCNLRLLLAAGLLCIISWIAARTGSWSGMYWIHFGERPENFFPAAALMFVVPHWLRHARYADFDPVYRVFALLTLFLPILVLSNWGGVSYLNLDRDVIEGGYQVAGFVLSGLVIWLGARRGWGHVTNTGTAFFVIFLYTKFFDWWWEVMPKYLFFLIVGLTAVLLLVILRRLRTAAKGGGR